MRHTQIEAYNKIKASGLLSERRFQVYDIIYKNQPITIANMIKIATSEIKILNTGSLTGRISELERAGVITPLRTGECPITGNNVFFWATTDELPVKVKKKITNSDKIKMIERIVNTAIDSRVGKFDWYKSSDGKKFLEIKEILKGK